MNISTIFYKKPILIIQLILGLTFFLYFLTLVYVKFFDDGYIKKYGITNENHIIVKHEENDYRKIELNKLNNKIYNEGEKVTVIYNKYNDLYHYYNFFDYYKGLLYSFIITIFFAFISYKDYISLKKN